MSHIAYYRVSTTDQSIESQRAALAQERKMDREYTDEGVSGAVPASQRPGFRALLDYIREGDTLHVYAVDRLGRDAIDIQSTIRELISKGVTVEIRGLGQIAKGVGELIIAVLAQVADMERQRIRERTSSGRELARATLAATGKTTGERRALVDRIEAMPGQFGYGAINIALASKKQPSSSTYRPPPSSATARRSTEQSPHRRDENKRINQ